MIPDRDCDFREAGKTQAKSVLFRAAAGVFSLTTTVWVCGQYPVHMKPGLCLAGKSHWYTHHGRLFHTRISARLRHTGARTRAHGSSTRVSRLVCAERSSVTFPRHIKEPPQWAKLWPPAQYASVRQREGVLLALSHLFWFYSRSPIAAANAELWVCCCTVATFLWSAGKLGERPPRNGVAISILCYILRSARTWTLRSQGRHMDKLTIHTYFNNVANVKMQKPENKVSK